MSRHWGIAAAILSLALAACTQPGEPDPPQPNTSRPSIQPSATTTGVSVAHPKRVDASTPCQAIITAADASAATGATATATTGISGPFHCFYDLTKTDGSDVGMLTISLVGDLTIATTAVSTLLAGNAAVEQRSSPSVCNFFVVLDSKKRLDAEGSALSVTAELRDLVNPCQAARELVEKGFSRLPDA